MLSNADLERLQRLCDRATRGPWSATYTCDDDGCETDEYTLITDRIFAMAQERKDVEFIAEARTAMPELIAEVRRLRGIVNSYECGAQMV